MKRFLYLSKIFIAGVLFASAFVACESNISDGATTDEVDDTELLQAIQNSSDKVTVSTSELPEVATAVLESEYPESYTSKVMKAAQLGYQVTLRKASGSTVGEAANVYFALGGRMLSAMNQYQNQVSDTCETARKERMGKKECFTFIFPISFTMPDESTITVETEDSWSVIKDWYVANDTVRDHPDLQYPVSIVFESGDTLEITSNEEMITARKECAPMRKGNGDKGHHQHNKCYTLVYPIDFTMPDGTIITVEAKDSIDDIKGWYAANPDSMSRPEIVFPIEVTLTANDSVITVESITELQELRTFCKGEGENVHSGNGAKNLQEVSFVYPISFEMPDSSIIELASVEEFSLIKDWYLDNLGVVERPTLVYPVSVTLEDGTVQVINTPEEFAEFMVNFVAHQHQHNNGEDNGHNGGDHENGGSNGNGGKRG